MESTELRTLRFPGTLPLAQRKQSQKRYRHNVVRACCYLPSRATQIPVAEVRAPV